MLRTSHTKLRAMREARESPTASSAQRERLDTLIARTEREVEQHQRNMVKAFSEAYDFSEVRFAYDFHYRRIQDGDFEGILLDTTRQPDPALQIQKQPVYVLRFGNTQPSGSSGIEGMIIMDNNMMDLEPPFPHYQRTNDFATFFGSIFPAEGQEQRDAIRIVGKLDTKLKRYRQRVGP